MSWSNNMAQNMVQHEMWIYCRIEVCVASHLIIHLLSGDLLIDYNSLFILAASKDYCTEGGDQRGSVLFVGRGLELMI